MVDAAEQVLVEYDPLPVVIDLEKALEGGATSSTPTSARTSATSGRSAAATSRPASRRPT